MRRLLWKAGGARSLTEPRSIEEHELLAPSSNESKGLMRFGCEYTISRDKMVENNTDDAKDIEKPQHLVSDRDRGILTQHDREYLLGETELDGQDERNARYRIRQRTIQALHDMSLLSFQGSHDDLEQITKEVDRVSIQGGIELMYDLLAADPDVTETLDELEGVVADAMTSVHAPSRDNVDEPGIYSVDASVDIDVEREQVEPAEGVPAMQAVVENQEVAEDLAEKINSWVEDRGAVEIFYPEDFNEDG